ncbi:type II secretion system F family protein [Pengzhenrongella sicca]|uniref:Type II secretion system F family protein n=1 Tax=Pengzhenrongella sicca TaxID=2819238 RepID=A0A8A4ZFY2_9MICO|nr:type II secretion system F family protein [Pengzhenrongella sicca]QTE28578.1 type II secretion system F family protein [Pengzhenrongella sicca]
MRAIVIAGAALVGVSLVVFVASLIPSPEPAPGPAATGRSVRAISRRTRLMLVGGLGGGLLAWVITGWVLAIVIVPVAALGLPALVSAPDVKAQIARLEAMEEWTRSLAGVLTVGLGLEAALMASVRSAPKPIEAEVTRLTSRLRSRWRTEDALRAFADDLDDATGDLIAANLILAARKHGTGLASVLEGLAESVADDVRCRRQVEADRAKPRATARWVTLISVAVLSVLSLASNYTANYATPLGQAVLTVLLAAYVGVLVWMKRMAAGKPWPRILPLSNLGARS